jgi:hypothetical protein
VHRPLQWWRWDFEFGGEHLGNLISELVPNSRDPTQRYVINIWTNTTVLVTVDGGERWHARLCAHYSISGRGAPA